MTRFDECIAFVLRSEGGYVDHPADPGGATNRGITQRTLAAWRGKPVSKADVQGLTEAEARLIYRAGYWAPVAGDKLPPGVDLAVLDAAVNSGPRQAARWLQRAIGVTDDGAIGPATLRALALCPPQQVASEINRLRLAFMHSLDGWAVFGRGWQRRMDELAAAIRA